MGVMNGSIEIFFSHHQGNVQWNLGRKTLRLKASINRYNLKILCGKM